MRLVSGASVTKGARAALRGASLTALCVALTFGASPAFAWGAEGHEAVAIVAYRALTPIARQRVDALLALEPGATLASVSSWADQSRDRSTAAWHYVNMPRGSDCVYQAARDCRDGQCVVEALNAQAQKLAATSGAEQLQALKYVVHFIGDVHQPLHAGFADDKGANTYQLQAFGRGTNLHALWDSGMVGDIAPGSASLARLVGSLPAPTLPLGFDPAAWAGESCRIASRPDFYPGRRLDSAYVETFEPLLQQRLLLAGLRLASLLNRTFSAVAPAAQR